MFKPEDFEIPLEKQLKLKIVNDDIDQCTNVEMLQESLKQCVKQLLSFQHLLGKTLEAQLAQELDKLLGPTE